MPDLVLRLARMEELATLEALQMRASLVAEEYREALLAHPEAVQLPGWQVADGHVFAALQDGEIVGFCVVLPREDGDAELDGMFVEPACWRAGVGRSLSVHACAIASQRGARHLHVVATPLARKFYEACGFELTGDAPTRFGPALAMRRAL